MKKHLAYSATLAISALLLTSCSGSVSLKPDSNSVEGSLSNYIELVTDDYDYELNDNGTDEIELKVRALQPMSESWADIVELGVQVLDNDGNVIAESDLDRKNISTRDMMKLLSLDKDETAEITVTNTNLADVSKILPLRLLNKIKGNPSPAKVRLVANLKVALPVGNYKGHGTFDGDKYPFTIMFTVHDTGDISGKYYYNKYGPATTMAISGLYDASTNEFNINEYAGRQCVGEFEGQVANGRISGEYNNFFSDTNYTFEIVLD